MSQEERRANFILRHSEQYQGDPVFKQMVDNTVYLSEGEKLDSIQAVLNRHGFKHGAFDERL